MQAYPGALFMIEHASELELDLDCVSSVHGGDDAWSAEETFQFSMQGFHTTPIPEDDAFYQKYSQVIDIRNANKKAALKIADYFKGKGQKVKHRNEATSIQEKSEKATY